MLGLEARRVGARVALIVSVVSALLVGTAWAKDYKVGQSGTSSDFKITVYGYQDPQPPPEEYADFQQPDPGTHYVTVDVQIKNTTDEQQTFSSLLGFHLLDRQNRQYDEELIVGIEPGPPEGQIPAKSAVRGFVTFQVPDDAPTPLRFRVQGSITASGAVWKLKPPPAPSP